MNKEVQLGKKFIWIIGLHRSGTTIMWQALRKDIRFTCYDEPLTEDLGNCFPRNNLKNTYDEYLKLFGADPKGFWELYEPMTPLQELDQNFTIEHKNYLTKLINHNPLTVIDETHLHLHLQALKELAPESYVIHLFRGARGFVTSHLSSGGAKTTSWHRRIVRFLRQEYDKSVFWQRTDFLPGLRRGFVIGSHPQSKFGLMLTNAGYDTERIMASSTVVKLLAYWHYLYNYVEVEGPGLFGERFKSLRYEEFASNPQKVMAEIYKWVDIPMQEGMAYTEVHPPKPPFEADNPHWRAAAKTAGFTGEQLELLL